MSDTNPSLLIVYIHGFGTTGLSSYKYGLIQKFTEKHSWINSVALEWQPNLLHITDALISQLTNHLKPHQDILFIGSSTGGNFALQLAATLQNFSIKIGLINPLINIEQRKIEDSRFPISLAEQLSETLIDLEKVYILLGMYDEVLNPAYTIKHYSHANIQMIEKGTHSLNEYLSENMEEWLLSII